MALVRILVDGYSLLHAWPELALGKPRHSAEARDALVQRLTHYQDAVDIPLTIVFDSAGAGPKPCQERSTRRLEVLYSGTGQTADQVIERAAYRFQPYGEVLAVTNDQAERNLVIHMGGMAESCRGFIRIVEATLAGIAEEVHRHNRKEQLRYRATRQAPHAK